jgi:hypothetical protein
VTYVCTSSELKYGARVLWEKGIFSGEVICKITNSSYADYRLPPFHRH